MKERKSVLELEANTVNTRWYNLEQVFLNVNVV